MQIGASSPENERQIVLEWNPKQGYSEAYICLEAITEYIVGRYKPSSGNPHAMEEYVTQTAPTGLFRLQEKLRKRFAETDGALLPEERQSRKFKDVDVSLKPDEISCLYRSLRYYTEDPRGEFMHQKSINVDNAGARLRYGGFAGQMAAVIARNIPECIEASTVRPQPFGFARAFQE